MGIRYCCQCCGQAFPANQMTAHGPISAICQSCAFKQLNARQQAEYEQMKSFEELIQSQRKEKDITDLVEIVTMIEQDKKDD